MAEYEEIVFKKVSNKIKKQSLRKRNFTEEVEDADEDEPADSLSETLVDLKEIQNLRKRAKGVDVIGLALGTKIPKQEQLAGVDPFKAKLGGMVDMHALKHVQNKGCDDAYDTGIGTSFSVETNARDEDDDMRKYIDSELAKRRGKAELDEGNTGKMRTLEESAFDAVPEHLRKSSSKTSEEMLSNQMLSGIPEVDLGIDAKIKNIEATEEAKQKLVKEQMRKKEGPSEFVPSNMAVNFVQHNRFNLDDGEHNKSRLHLKKSVTIVTEEEAELKPPLVSKRVDEKATDDFYYEKFKKQFRR